MTKGTIERAFELAPSCGNIEDIRSALRREGYSNVDAHLAGRVIRYDLTKLLGREAQGRAIRPCSYTVLQAFHRATTFTVSSRG